MDSTFLYESSLKTAASPHQSRRAVLNFSGIDGSETKLEVYNKPGIYRAMALMMSKGQDTAELCDGKLTLALATKLVTSRGKRTTTSYEKPAALLELTVFATHAPFPSRPQVIAEIPSYNIGRRLIPHLEETQDYVWVKPRSQLPFNSRFIVAEITCALIENNLSALEISVCRPEELPQSRTWYLPFSRFLLSQTLSQRYSMLSKADAIQLLRDENFIVHEPTVPLYSKALSVFFRQRDGLEVGVLKANGDFLSNLTIQPHGLTLRIQAFGVHSFTGLACTCLRVTGCNLPMGTQTTIESCQASRGSLKDELKVVSAPSGVQYAMPRTRLFNYRREQLRIRPVDYASMKIGQIASVVQRYRPAETPEPDEFQLREAEKPQKRGAKVWKQKGSPNKEDCEAGF